MTSTNKAFERYFRIEAEEVRSVLQLKRKSVNSEKLKARQ
jgi:hypothetical protein